MVITISFAIGHGLSLFIFSKIISNFEIFDSILSYADTISSTVIILIGVYLLYLVINNRIYLSKYSHKNETRFITSAFSIGIIMGIGGIRGMLITLSVISHNEISFFMIFYFTSGVILVFMIFGLIIAFINEKLLHSKQNIRRVFTTLGIISILIGVNMLLL